MFKNLSGRTIAPLVLGAARFSRPRRAVQMSLRVCRVFVQEEDCADSGIAGLATVLRVGVSLGIRPRRKSLSLDVNLRRSVPESVSP